MIVSHRWKFIFVKTRKTAGSSVERFLLPHLGPDDVIRSFETRNASGRFNPWPELAAHHDRANARLTVEQWLRRERYYTHMPAWRLRNRVGASTWDSYTTFCFERDPWDKLVSFYYWRTRDEAERPDFETWVHSTPGLRAWPQYTIDDRVAVDVVGRYERLEDDLAEVLDRIGLDVAIDLPRDKSGHRPPTTDAAEVPDVVTFSPALDAWVAGQFAPEIALMGYERPRRR